MMEIAEKQAGTLEIPYLDSLGLTEKPFSMTPDPAFYFESKSHKKAADYLRFFLAQREGFAVVYGDVGTGKTLLCRQFLNSLDRNVFNIGLILNPIMDETEFLKELLRELNIPDRGQERLFTVDGRGPAIVATKKEMLEALEAYLLGEYRKGKETILAIDEAQLLSDDMFEFLRVLSNFETNKDKILHIMLFGQEELLGRLGESRMRYLAQRITVIHYLSPLEEHEVALYVTHRLLKAGSNGLVQFSPWVLKKIYRVSRGYPRIVNIICDRCLLQLYAKSKTVVDQRILEAVFREESVHTLIKEVKSTGDRRAGKAYLFTLAVALAGLIAFLVYRNFKLF